jgi:hypothetical protein
MFSATNVTCFVSFCVCVAVSTGIAHAQKNGSKPGTCTNIPVTVTLNAVTVGGVPSSANGGLYGETNSDGVSYTNGSEGTSAILQCGGTLILNLQNSSRHFTVDFSDQLPAGMDPGAIPYTGPQPGYVIQIPSLGAFHNGSTGGYFTTWMQASLSTAGQQIMGPNGEIFYCNLDGSFYNDCGAGAKLADKYSDTSVIDVYVAPNCAYWTVTPRTLTNPPDTTLIGYQAAGLVRGVSTHPANALASGQYSMPFNMTVVRTDVTTATCNGLF